MTLPELPERIASFRCYVAGDLAEVKTYSKDMVNGNELFAALQMREYAMQAVLAEREANAKICDAIYAEERKDSPCYGFAAECAAAIRAQGVRP